MSKVVPEGIDLKGWYEGRCPFCGNEDQAGWGSTRSGDNRFRLYFCDECGRYWKVVDEEVGRKIPRVLYDASTSHLDLAASEEGLKRPPPGEAPD